MYIMINELKCFFQCPHIVLIIRKLFAVSCSPVLLQRITRKDNIFTCRILVLSSSSKLFLSIMVKMPDEKIKLLRVFPDPPINFLHCISWLCLSTGLRLKWSDPKYVWVQTHLVFWSVGQNPEYFGSNQKKLLWNHIL